MKRITLLISSSQGEYWKLAKYCAPNKLEYCLRHNIQFTMRQHIQISPWGERPQFMIEELERMKPGEWLWFMGTDTLITNMTIDVRKFMTDEAPDFTIAKDMHGINNDVFFIRRTEASLAFLKSILAMNKLYSDDQQAMNHLLKQDEISVKYETMENINSYLFDEYPYYKGMGLSTASPGHWTPGRFILHLPGMSNERRFTLMEKHLADVVR